MDYYDDYSPYMEIDLMKMEDGYKDTNSDINVRIYIAAQTVKKMKYYL